jgi:hypothetical protein
MSFFIYRLSGLVLLAGLSLIIPYFISGLLWGFYLALLLFLHLFVSHPQALPPANAPDDELVQSVHDEINRVDMKHAHVIYKVIIWVFLIIRILFRVG